MSPIKIAIVGLGVMGGSIAKALAKQTQVPVRVAGIDIDQQTLALALKEGVIEKAETSNQTILQEADLVFITLYPSAIIPFVEENRANFKAGAILTDVTGIKGDLIQQVLEVLPPEVDFIFGHPMAGKESQGYAYADGEVFHGANYLITPTESNQPANIEKLEELISLLGFKRISQVNPRKHDQMIAYTSQLCHVLAVSLINLDQDQAETIQYIGDSYRDLTRIAKINEQLWTDLFILNKEALLSRIDAFEDQLLIIKEAIEKDDQGTLIEMFKESTRRRVQLEEEDLRQKQRSKLEN